MKNLIVSVKFKITIYGVGGVLPPFQVAEYTAPILTVHSRHTHSEMNMSPFICEKIREGVHFKIQSLVIIHDFCTVCPY